MKKFRVWNVRRGRCEAWAIVEASDAEQAKEKFLKSHRYLVWGCFTTKAKGIKK